MGRERLGTWNWHHIFAAKGAVFVKFAVLLGFGLLAACIPRSEPAPVAKESLMEVEVTALPILGPAPELQNEIWLNSDRPLRLAELRGKVVLIDMWTFG